MGEAKMRAMSAQAFLWATESCVHAASVALAVVRMEVPATTAKTRLYASRPAVRNAQGNRGGLYVLLYMDFNTRTALNLFFRTLRGRKRFSALAWATCTTARRDRFGCQCKTCDGSSGKTVRKSRGTFSAGAGSGWDAASNRQSKRRRGAMDIWEEESGKP